LPLANGTAGTSSARQACVAPPSPSTCGGRHPAAPSLPRVLTAPGAVAGRRGLRRTFERCQQPRHKPGLSPSALVAGLVTRVPASPGPALYERSLLRPGAPPANERPPVNPLPHHGLSSAPLVSTP